MTSRPAPPSCILAARPWSFVIESNAVMNLDLLAAQRMIKAVEPTARSLDVIWSKTLFK